MPKCAFSLLLSVFIVSFSTFAAHRELEDQAWRPLRFLYDIGDLYDAHGNLIEESDSSEEEIHYLSSEDEENENEHDKDGFYSNEYAYFDESSDEEWYLSSSTELHKLALGKDHENAYEEDSHDAKRAHLKKREADKRHRALRDKFSVYEAKKICHRTKLSNRELKIKKRFLLFKKEYKKSLLDTPASPKITTTKQISPSASYSKKIHREYRFQPMKYNITKFDTQKPSYLYNFNKRPTTRFEPVTELTLVCLFTRNLFRTFNHFQQPALK